MSFIKWLGDYGGKLCECFQNCSIALLALPQLQVYAVELMVTSIIAKQVHSSFFPDPIPPESPAKVITP